MRFLRKLFLLVIVIFFLLYALDRALQGMFGWGAHPIFDPILASLPDTVYPFTDLTRRIIWGVIFAFVLIYILLFLSTFKPRPNVLRVRTIQGDTMLLEPGAITKFVRLQIENHPAVVDHKVRVRASGSRGIAVKAKVSVRPIDSLPAIKQELEATIREGFERVIGIEKIDEISLIMGLDEKSLNEQPGPRLTPRPKPEAPVRGELAEPEEREAIDFNHEEPSESQEEFRESDEDEEDEERR